MTLFPVNVVHTLLYVAMIFFQESLKFEQSQILLFYILTFDFFLGSVHFFYLKEGKLDYRTAKVKRPRKTCLTSGFANGFYFSDFPAK